MSAETSETQPTTFVETALKLGGKSEEEVRKTGAIDRADDQVEALFLPKYQTTGSPVHRAVWDRDFPAELFASKQSAASPKCEQIMQSSLDIVRRRRENGTLVDAERKITQEVLDELAAAGYWGLLVDEQHGGAAMPFTTFSRSQTARWTGLPVKEQS